MMVIACPDLHATNQVHPASACRFHTVVRRVSMTLHVTKACVVTSTPVPARSAKVFVFPAYMIMNVRQDSVATRKRGGAQAFAGMNVLMAIARIQIRRHALITERAS
jgi:hypothetical protein